MTNGSKFSAEHWALTSDRLAHALKENFPSELRKDGASKEEDKEKESSKGFKVIKGKCTVQLNLVETLNEIVFTHYSSLATSHLLTLLDALLQSYSFATSANANILVRNSLQKTGILELLLRLETMSISCYFRVLFRMYAESTNDAEQRKAIAEERLIG